MGRAVRAVIEAGLDQVTSLWRASQNPAPAATAMSAGRRAYRQTRFKSVALTRGHTHGRVQVESVPLRVGGRRRGDRGRIALHTESRRAPALRASPHQSFHGRGGPPREHWGRIVRIARFVLVDTVACDERPNVRHDRRQDLGHVGWRGHRGA